MERRIPILVIASLVAAVAWLAAYMLAESVLRPGEWLEYTNGIPWSTIAVRVRNHGLAWPVFARWWCLSSGHVLWMLPFAAQAVWAIASRSLGRWQRRLLRLTLLLEAIPACFKGLAVLFGLLELPSGTLDAELLDEQHYPGAAGFFVWLACLLAYGGHKFAAARLAESAAAAVREAQLGEQSADPGAQRLHVGGAVAGLAMGPARRVAGVATTPGWRRLIATALTLVLAGWLAWGLNHPSVLVMDVENREAEPLLEGAVFGAPTFLRLPAILPGERRTFILRHLADTLEVSFVCAGRARVTYLPGYVGREDTLRASLIISPGRP